MKFNPIDAENIAMTEHYRAIGSNTEHQCHLLGYMQNGDDKEEIKSTKF